LTITNIFELAKGQYPFTPLKTLMNRRCSSKFSYCLLFCDWSRRIVMRRGESYTPPSANGKCWTTIILIPKKCILLCHITAWINHKHR
jgi:hypothetical protein